jgi:tryptophan halogenase
MRVESIVIVGGGSSGWMTAAMLSKTFPKMQIGLIEGAEGPIGVGESTLGHFNRFLRRLGLKDKDWMPACNATYKTSIAFKNFRDGKGERFQYPFGEFDLFDYKDSLMRYFELQCEYGMEKYPPEQFANFANNQTYLADRCKISADAIPDCIYSMDKDTAYHFDAGLFGNFLRDTICIPNGVLHLKGTIEKVMKNPDGSIDSLVTDQDGLIKADLYVDCTGFKSLLLEQHMGSEFISFKDKLFNDTALATQVPYSDRENQMETYTDCVAMNAGWVWNIPLWHRVGTGYVYSSDYINECEAEVEFRKYLSERYTPEIAKDAELRKIDIRHGKRDKAWVKNVVGIGLSYAFLEPLESTGLMTTHENVLLLCDTLEKRQGFYARMEQDAFNYSCDNMIESMKCFVALHYALSQRDDNQYWRDCTNINFDIDPTWRHSTRVAHGNTVVMLEDMEDAFYNLAQNSGSIYIAAGQGYRPFSEGMYHEKRSWQKMLDDEWVDNIHDIHTKYQQDRKVMIDWVDQLPSHYEYLRDNIYDLQEEETVG